MGQDRAEDFRIDFDSDELLTLETLPPPLTHLVAPVIARSPKGEVIPFGSAFCLAHLKGSQAFFATARHVIEQLERVPVGWEPFVLIPRNEPPPLDLFGARVAQLSLADEFSDVAVLKVDLSEFGPSGAVPLRNLPVSFGKPVESEKCMALGYGEMLVGQRIRADEQETSHAWNYKLHASRGTIEEVHPKARDRGMVNFPSFRTAAIYPHGMSGGPIIDIRGRVIGIVASGFDNTPSYGCSDRSDWRTLRGRHVGNHYRDESRRHGDPWSHSD